MLEEHLRPATGLTWRDHPLDDFLLGEVPAGVYTPAERALIKDSELTLFTESAAVLAKLLAVAAAAGAHEKKTCLSWLAEAKQFAKNFLMGMARSQAATGIPAAPVFRMESMFGLREPSEMMAVGTIGPVYTVTIAPISSVMCARGLLCPECKSEQVRAFTALVAEKPVDPHHTFYAHLERAGVPLDHLRRARALVERKLADVMLGFKLPADPADALAGSEWCVTDHDHTCDEGLDGGMTNAFFYTRPREQIDEEIRASMRTYDVGNGYAVDEPTCRIVKMMGMEWLPKALYERNINAYQASAHWYEVPGGAVGLSVDGLGRTIVHVATFSQRCAPGAECTCPDIPASVGELPEELETALPDSSQGS